MTGLRLLRPITRAAPARRRLLALGLSAAVAPAALAARDCDVCGVEADPTQFEFLQPSSPTPRAFMQIAFEARAFAEKRGDPGSGAVVVINNMVAGAAPNRTVSGRDPTAFAEIEAIRDACRRLAAGKLDGATLYATAKPDRMCELACYHAGISRIVYGAGLTDGGAPRNEAC